MPQQHIVKAYDKELAALDQLIADMARQVRVLLTESVTSLVRNDDVLAQSVIKSDKEIDALQVAIDKQATMLLALRQPMAADLRTIIASLRVSNDLERMGDYAKNISKRTITLSKIPMMASAARSVERMSMLACAMIDDVLEAWLQRDIELALKVIHQDEEVDQLHTSLFREILTYMMEDPRNITACTHLMFISKNIERVGDHATNIAEQLYFAVKGKAFNEGHVSLDEASAIVAEQGSDK
jgi:phosphate transport system protein